MIYLLLLLFISLYSIAKKCTCRTTRCFLHWLLKNIACIVQYDKNTKIVDSLLCKYAKIQSSISPSVYAFFGCEIPFLML